MLRLCLTIIVSLIVVTACTTEEPVTDIPFSTATSEIVGTIEAPSSIGDSPIPGDFTGGNPIILQGLGTFEIWVSGDVEAQINSGTSVYNYLPDTGFLPARNQLFLSSSDANASQQLSFELSPGLQAGEYNLLSPENYIPGGVSVSYSRLGSNGIEAYIENIEGSVNLSAIGEVISGEFQFSADYTETNDDGEVDVKTIVVIGSFEDIPYQSTVDDPFEIIVPLPTRNFTSDTTSTP